MQKGIVLILLSVVLIKCYGRVMTAEAGCDVSCGPNSECVNGRCKCISGYSDCNNNMDDGCETNIWQINLCGNDCSNRKDCSTIVKNANGIFCNEGICDYEVCIYPYEDNDHDMTNGCEFWSQFPKTYGGSNYDEAYSIKQTTDAGFIVAGWTASFSAGDYDVWIIRLDANGDIIWEKSYGESYYDWASSIQLTSDGGYVVVGNTEPFNDAYNSDFRLLRLNNDGYLLWQKNYGGNNLDWASSIQQNSDGGFIIAGWTASFSAGDYDFWVIRLDANGDIIWEKSYGGSGSDEATSIQQTLDGGFVVAGKTYSFGAGDYDFWVIRLDANGDIIWEKSYGGSGSDEATSIQQTLDGGFVVAGKTYSFGAGDYDVWILKLDSEGKINGNCGNIEKNTNAAVNNTNATVIFTSATIIDTIAYVSKCCVSEKNTTCIMKVQCTEP